MRSSPKEASKKLLHNRSNFDAGQLRTLATTSRVTPALNQCKLSVVHHDQPTIDYCRTAGITYQSYSPLCGGFNGSSCSRSGGENVMTRPDVLAIADSHGVSAAQIGLKWIVQKGFPLTTAVWDLKYMRVRALGLASRHVRLPSPYAFAVGAARLGPLELGQLDGAGDDDALRYCQRRRVPGGAAARLRS